MIKKNMSNSPQQPRTSQESVEDSMERPKHMEQSASQKQTLGSDERSGTTDCVSTSPVSKGTAT